MLSFLASLPHSCLLPVNYHYIPFFKGKMNNETNSAMIEVISIVSVEDSVGLNCDSLSLALLTLVHTGNSRKRPH